MIDEKKLIEDILYSDKWNNQPCPMWVIRMIVANSKEDTPVVNHTHVMASDVINQDNAKLSVQDAIRYIDQLFEPPCNYLLGTVDIEDQMKQQIPEWCAKCRTHLKTECWQKYFEMRKEEEGKWEK